MPAQKKFAVFDIDGTLIRWQLFHAIVDRLAKAGHVPAETYNEAHEARMYWKRRSGEESFRNYERKLVHAYMGSLKQLRVADFQHAVDAVFAEHKDQVYTYTRDFISKLKAKNYLLFAISASQTEAVAKIADYYGFDDHVGTTYEQKDDRFTGELELVAYKKPEILQRLIDKHGASLAGSIGVADSESDASMLDMVEHPIAFNPSRKLFIHAREHGWKVVIERKNMVYELEPHNGTYILKHTNA